MSRLFPDPDPGEIIADLASEGHVGAELSARAFRGTQAQGEADGACWATSVRDGVCWICHVNAPAPKSTICPECLAWWLEDEP